MAKNAEVLRIFNDIANFLELTGAGDRFKIEAYRRAARSLESLGEDLRKVSDRGELDTIPGVGAALAEKIREYLATGKIEYYEKLAAQIPPGLLRIMQIPGVGPKTTRRFWVELKVESPAQLSEAIEQGRLNGLKGFGARKIEVLREGLKPLGADTPAEVRRPILVAWELAERVVADLRAKAPVEELVVAGSLRRGRETVGDIDLLATSSEPERVFDAFTALPGIRQVRLRGETKETVIFDPGIQIDLRVVPAESFGAAIQYFTGSKDHNIRLRSLARDRGLKINEYGVFRGEERVAGRTEEEVYGALELPMMAPEIRENSGEIEAAQGRTLPRLVGSSDLQGDLHVHIDLFDGDRFPAWRSAAAELGLRYLGLIVPPKFAENSNELAKLRSAWKTEAPHGKIELYLGVERSPQESGPLPEALDYWAIHPGPGSEPPVPAEGDAPPPAFVAHMPVHDGAERAAWHAWAREESIGLEVTPRPEEDGIDSGTVRRMTEAGVPLYVSAVARRPEELARLRLALRLARRGWASADAVATTRAPVRPPAGSHLRQR